MNRSKPLSALGRRKLFVMVIGMLIVWLGVLPQVAHHPAMRRHIDRNRKHRIQADAMFYTELGPVKGITIEHRREGIVIGKTRMAPAAPE